MRHIKKMTAQYPQPAQMTVGAIFTALSQIMQVVGTMLIEKQAMDMDPYDY
jgi:hypothetical protein